MKPQLNSETIIVDAAQAIEKLKMNSRKMCTSNQVQDAPDNSLDNVSMRLGNHLLKFENSEIDEDSLNKARNELRETPDVVEKSLETFRKLLEEESDLNYPKDDDKKLQIFLRPCKYYPHSALERMKNFYKFKYKHPVYSKNLTPREEKRAFLQNLLTILPYRNKNGERILIVEAGSKWNPRKCTLIEIIRSLMVILEAALEEPKTQINGVQVIVDLNGLSLQQVWQFSTDIAKNLVDWIQNCIPLRVKGIHVVNQPFIFNIAYALVKPLLQEKLRKRLIIHGSDFQSLHKYVSNRYLPKEYGGDLDIPLSEGQELHSCMAKYDDKFREKMFYGYS